ncbi:hypothetical protein PTTG_09782 [Puccinia triticina 1-1 BBBD Race 1]|uniref:Uncharacterized protein n=1 Tax=Puccinia triticina (isolate 1-1 / race 1 (BBBD)) TaxID=630390 RepID=A0A180FZQ4_PUCT1|nr:hypothetical protein PTTG_09782 [Puccinia triticina 1-1 BBBD Race 1]
MTGPVVFGSRSLSKTTNRLIIKTFIALLCNSAYLNLLPVILNTPSGVVASFSSGFKDFESASLTANPSFLDEAGESSHLLPEGRGIGNPSGLTHERPLSEGPRLHDDSNSNMESGATNRNTDEKGFQGVNESSLLQRIRHKDEEVSTLKKSFDQHGVALVIRYKYESASGKIPKPETIASLKTAEREYRLERWWSGLYNFFRSIFKRGQWKKDKLYLNLKKLRTDMDAKNIEFPVAVEKAINRLSILEYKGFDFSAEEGRLIERLSKQAKSAQGTTADDSAKLFQLDEADKRLINEIGWKKVAETKVREIEGLLKVYRQAKLQNPTNNQISKIEASLETLVPIITHDDTQWNPEYTTLLQTFTKLKDDSEFPSDLELDQKTEDRIAILGDERKRIQRYSPAIIKH